MFVILTIPWFQVRVLAGPPTLSTAYGCYTGDQGIGIPWSVGVETGAPVSPSFRIATIFGPVNRFFMSVLAFENGLYSAHSGPASGGRS